MESTKETHKSSVFTEEKEQLELKKLRLEIESLQGRNAKGMRLLPFMPLITTLVAVAGLWFGVVRFFGEQRQVRILRSEGQIRTNIDQILSFPNNEQLSVSRVLFLLADLRDLVQRDPEEIQKITNILAELIQQSDFDKLRDIRLSVTVFEQWPEYLQKIRTDPVAQNRVTYKYYQAFRHLHDEDPEYFETLNLDANSNFVVGPGGYTEESRFLRFERLFWSFSWYLKTIKANPPAWEQAIKRFSEAIRNEHLTEKLRRGL